MASKKNGGSGGSGLGWVAAFSILANVSQAIAGDAKDTENLRLRGQVNELERQLRGLQALHEQCIAASRDKDRQIADLGGAIASMKAKMTPTDPTDVKK